MAAKLGSRLPAADELDLPGWGKLRRGVVQPTTRSRARRLDRDGVFDIPKRWVLKDPDAWPVTVWSRPTVRQSEPRLYHALDLLVVQLDSWMRREGMRTSQIVDLLRRRCSLRYTLLSRATHEPGAQIVHSPRTGGSITSEPKWADFNDRLIAADLPRVSDVFVFPLPWLGIFRGGRAKLEKMRKDSATVTSRRRAG
jgi:hypothetical protein